MRAQIDPHGVLTITPDTPTEAFALAVYAEKALVHLDVPAELRLSPTKDRKPYFDTAKLIINAAWPQEQPK